MTPPSDRATLRARPHPYTGYHVRHRAGLRMHPARRVDVDARPLLYDLFCKAGGATKGYQMAGFRVIGIDIEPQKNYIGDGFIQMDALEFLRRYLRGEFERADAFHASPPCQRWSDITPAAHRDKHPNLIAPIRNLLKATGKPFVIENVPGARKHLKNPIRLCGSGFGLGIFRHRYFELSGFEILMLPPCQHDFKPVYLTGSTGNSKSPKGMGIRKDFSADAKRQASGISWMVTDELDEAIPPAYTHFIGKHLMTAIKVMPLRVHAAQQAEERTRRG